MRPTDFMSKWDAYITRIGLTEKFPLYKLPAPDGRLSLFTNDFLIEAGLPDAAGLRFEGLSEGLRRASDVYGRVYGRAYDRSAHSRERLYPYLILGYDEGGNPICLDTANQERIVFLNHERNFALAEVVNSGVADLAQCILAYQELVEEYQNEYGEEAEFYEGNVPVSLVQRTVDSFRQIDPASVEGHCYWPGTLDYI